MRRREDKSHSNKQTTTTSSSSSTQDESESHSFSKNKSTFNTVIVPATVVGLSSNDGIDVKKKKNDETTTNNNDDDDNGGDTGSKKQQYNKKKKQNGDTKPKGIATARIVAVEIAGSGATATATPNMMANLSDEETANLLSTDEPPTAVVSAQPMVEVIAPAALTENYQFPATAAGRTFMVTVPKGGVKAGQRFSVPLPPEEECIHPRVQVPVGHWKDGFWDLFSYGFCHPTVLNSCCCTTIAAGQTISRLQLTWKGQHTTSVAEASGAFQKLFILVCIYWTIRACMFMLIATLDPNAKFDGSAPDYTHYEEPSNWYYLCCALDDLIWYGYYAFCVYLLKNVRKHIRAKYAIPEGQVCPGGCEDVCCSLVCPCFTAAQMLRHTTDYDMYPAQCCSNTGLPAHVPSIV